MNKNIFFAVILSTVVVLFAVFSYPISVFMGTELDTLLESKETNLSTHVNKQFASVLKEYDIDEIEFDVGILYGVSSIHINGHKFLNYALPQLNDGIKGFKLVRHGNQFELTTVFDRKTLNYSQAKSSIDAQVQRISDNYKKQLRPVYAGRS